MIVTRPPHSPHAQNNAPTQGSLRGSAENAKVLDEVDFADFRPGRTYDQKNATLLATLSCASYSYPEDQWEHLSMQPAVHSFAFLDSKNNADLGIPAPDSGTQVSLVQLKGALLVAARGSSPPWSDENSDESNWADFQNDMVAVPVNNYDGSGKVHKGFKDAADGIWDQLKPQLQAALAAHLSIHMGGHSLGGAVALMLADRMEHELHAVPQTIVRVGAPDIGWKEEKAHLESVGVAQRCYDYKNCTDPCPNILSGSVEAGREIYLDRNGVADISGSSHKKDKALGAAQDSAAGHPDPTYRHHIRGYLAPMGDAANHPILKPLEH